MKKSLFLTALFVAALSWTMAQTVVFSDNFDSYTAGSRLAQTSTAAWTTWSNAPGSAEDAAISSTQAASAPNSLYITGSNDIIYPFANQTSGHYKIECILKSDSKVSAERENLDSLIKSLKPGSLISSPYFELLAKQY